MMIREDPVLCAQYFQNRNTELVKYLCNPSGPFGTNHVYEYVHRREYQMRGSPHEHGLYWLKDAPEPDIITGNNFDTCASFVDKFISCDYITLPNMHYHIHICTFTCHKGQSNSMCRFHYPQFVMKQTKIMFQMKMENRNAKMFSNLKKS